MMKEVVGRPQDSYNRWVVAQRVKLKAAHATLGAEESRRLREVPLPHVGGREARRPQPGQPTLTDEKALAGSSTRAGEDAAVGRGWSVQEVQALSKYFKEQSGGGRAEGRQRPSWHEGRVASWVTTVDHKRIGILYISRASPSSSSAACLALLMRTQLATPNENFLERKSYNQLLTIHGTTMVFLVVVPILAGFGNFLVPLMIGAKDMAFPRLNAFSYWMFLLGGIVLYGSWFAKGGAATCGWTCYATLSETRTARATGSTCGSCRCTC